MKGRVFLTYFCIFLSGSERVTLRSLLLKINHEKKIRSKHNKQYSHNVKLDKVNSSHDVD